MAFTIQTIFSLACRDRCISKMRTLVPLPTHGKSPQIPAAVMVPVVRVKGTPSILYTVRSSKLRMNTGHISFPGGKAEKGETPAQTALRHIRTDLGILPDKINVWGHGAAIASRTNDYLITPVVGVMPDLKDTDLDINMDEVSEAFSVPIHVLCNPHNQFYTQFSNGYILPVYVAEDYKIWGITAYITHVFLSCALSKETYQSDWLKNKIALHSPTPS